MPSRKHQRLVVLLTEFPELFVDLVRKCSGIDVPGDLELLPGPETVRFPSTERVADGAVVLRHAEDGNREAFVLEVQLREDVGKLKSWAAYVVGTSVQLGCPATLLVVTLSDRVAKWAGKPIDLGRGRMTLEPLVVGPKQIPSEISLGEARARPDWLALIVMAHGQKRGSERLNRMAMKVAREVLARGDRRSIVVADLIVGSMREDVRRMLQAETDAETGWGKTIWFSEIGKAIADGWAKGRRLGQQKGKAEGLQKGLQKGKAEGLQEGLQKGKAEALLTVLETRGLELTARQRAKIKACRDLETLQEWLRRAVQATSVREVFA